MDMDNAEYEEFIETAEKDRGPLVQGNEPCGCPWSNADHPFTDDINEMEPVTTDLIECMACGAVWSAKDDDRYVTLLDDKYR